MVKRRADQYCIDYAAQFIVGLREMPHICLFPYDTRNPQARQETLDMTTHRIVQKILRCQPREGRTHE